MQVKPVPGAATSVHATPVKPLPEDHRSYDLKIASLNSKWKIDRGEDISGQTWWAYGGWRNWNAQNETVHAKTWSPGYPAPGPWTQAKVDEQK